MTSRSERWVAGAGKYNEEQFKQRLEEYAINPDKCLFCEQKMPYVPLNQRIKRKFCNKSCAAKHNNQKRIQTGSIYQKGLTKEVNCIVCEANIKIGKNANALQAKCFNCNAKKYVVKICKCCNKQFETQTSQTSCSKECLINLKRKAASRGGKISASISVKRSKDEIELYTLCKEYFKSVRHNEIIKDGWDADIIIDDYQIAVLWNGPWHYKQLTLKNHSLSQVQTRDKIKLQVLQSDGWNVVVFEDRYYTPSQAFDALKKLVAEAGFEPFVRV